MLKGELVLVLELHMNLVLTLVYIYYRFMTLLQQKCCNIILSLQHLMVYLKIVVLLRGSSLKFKLALFSRGHRFVYPSH